MSEFVGSLMDEPVGYMGTGILLARVKKRWQMVIT